MILRRFGRVNSSLFKRDNGAENYHKRKLNTPMSCFMQSKAVSRVKGLSDESQLRWYRAKAPLDGCFSIIRRNYGIF